MSYKARLGIITICIFLLGLSLATTNPNSVPIAFLVVPLLILAVLFYNILQFIMYFFRIFNRNSKKRRVSALVITCLSVGAFVFQTVGGLTASDLIILLTFCVLSVFYLVKLL